MTEIIVSLLVAAGIDSTTHVRVKFDAEVKVEIEEQLVEVQEGPLIDENDGDNENNLYDQVNMAE